MDRPGRTPSPHVSDTDWEEQAAALRLERQPAQAPLPNGSQPTVDGGVAKVHVPHPGGSWVVDWRRSDTGATVNHIPTVPSEGGGSVDSVSSEEVEGRREWNWSDSDGDGEDVAQVEGNAAGKGKRRERTESAEDSEESEAGRGMGRGRRGGGPRTKKVRTDAGIPGAAGQINADAAEGI
ncbi:hypothetical protein CF319_g8697 [Tilletia indica]|nr:hypothetical protein CF319_g8697 [Tilletia indica]